MKSMASSLLAERHSQYSLEIEAEIAKPLRIEHRLSAPVGA
jgi:hypothetical protein